MSRNRHGTRSARRPTKTRPSGFCVLHRHWIRELLRSLGRSALHHGLLPFRGLIQHFGIDALPLLRRSRPDELRELGRTFGLPLQKECHNHHPMPLLQSSQFLPDRTFRGYRDQFDRRSLQMFLLSCRYFLTGGLRAPYRQILA